MALSTSELPDGMGRALAGDRLAEETGRTLLVIATDADGWPRVATLSVGEVYAPDARTVLLSLYASSRTAAAIRVSGRALLLGDDDGAIVRVRLEPVEVEDPVAAEAGRVSFRSPVVAVEIDAVPYARVTHGIQFELLDGAAALDRWQRQLAGLRAIA